MSWSGEVFVNGTTVDGESKQYTLLNAYLLKYFKKKFPNKEKVVEADAENCDVNIKLSKSECLDLIDFLLEYNNNFITNREIVYPAALSDYERFYKIVGIYHMFERADHILSKVNNRNYHATKRKIGFRKEKYKEYYKTFFKPEYRRKKGSFGYLGFGNKKFKNEEDMKKAAGDIHYEVGKKLPHQSAKEMTKREYIFNLGFYLKSLRESNRQTVRNYSETLHVTRIISALTKAMKGKSKIKFSFDNG
jgi:hypothetical protein